MCVCFFFSGRNRQSEQKQKQGPLEFGLTGVMASLVSPLASNQISVFPVSTFDTDYLLVSSSSVSRAVIVLKDAGHNVVCDKDGVVGASIVGE